MLSASVRITAASSKSCAWTYHDAAVWSHAFGLLPRKGGFNGNTFLPHHTTFGQVRMALPSDADAVVAMAHKLAAHDEDTASLSRVDLLREVFSDPP
jgi:hypothetical protein